MDKKRISILLLLIIISTLLEFKFANLSLTHIQGNWENNDQTLQIPAAYRLSEDQYFVNDPVINEYIKIYPTLLFSLIAAVYNILSDMMLTYFILFLALKTVFVISAYLLASLLLKNKNLALLAAFLLAFTHFMGADEIGVSELLPKDFVFAFAPLILYLFLKDREKYSIPCFAGLGTLSYFHIFSIVPVLLMLSYSLISEKKYRLFLLSALAFAAISSPFLFEKTAQGPEATGEILQAVPYANLMSGLITTAKYLPLIILGFIVARKNNTEIFGWFLIISIYSLSSLAGLFSEKILLFTLYRAYKYVIFFSFIFSAWFAGNLFKKNKAAGVLSVCILALYFSSIHYSTIFDGITKNMADYSRDIADAVAVGKWIDSNTGKNETFIAPPDWSILKPWAKRPIIFTESDQYIISYSPSKFPDKNIYVEIKNAYKEKTSQRIFEIAKEKGIQIVVLYKSASGQSIFQSGNFKIYRVS